MAAGGPQMLATSNVCGADAAVRRRVLWCFVLQTSMDRCTMQRLQSAIAKVCNSLTITLTLTLTL